MVRERKKIVIKLSTRGTNRPMGEEWVRMQGSKWAREVRGEVVSFF